VDYFPQSNIDDMNGALRDVFVQLYDDQPLLKRLLETWQMHYPDLEFPELPKRGELELKQVKEATYFFLYLVT
jgi:DNA-directed RNA polymerase